jgi:hypothetical protein
MFGCITCRNFEDATGNIARSDAGTNPLVSRGSAKAVRPWLDYVKPLVLFLGTSLGAFSGVSPSSDIQSPKALIDAVSFWINGFTTFADISA